VTLCNNGQSDTFWQFPANIKTRWAVNEGGKRGVDETGFIQHVLPAVGRA
jgi:hypothetical protein